MPISVTCPSGHKINASEKYAGKVVKCPKCSQPFKIPNAAASEPQVSHAVPADDPFANLPAGFDNAGDGGADPFGDLSDLTPASYSPQSYSKGGYSQGGYAAPGGAKPGPKSADAGGGKKGQLASKTGNKPILLFAIIGGGAALVLALVAIGAFVFMGKGSDSGSSSNGSLTSGSNSNSNSNSAAAAEREFELAKAQIISDFHPDGAPEGPGAEEFNNVLKSLQNLSSPTAPVYFGFDSSMRAKMRDYMTSKGISEGKATLLALQVAAGLSMRGAELDIPADANGNFPIPDSPQEFRQMVLDTEIDESVGTSSFAELKPLLQGLREKTLSPEETELAFYLKLILIRD